MFDGGGIQELSPRYADSIIKTINQFDKFTEQGLINRANLFAESFFEVYTAISEIDSRDLQNVLFPIMEDIDWTDASSLSTAIDNLENYMKVNGDEAPKLESTLNALEEAKKNLIFNVETEFQNYKDAIEKAVEGTSTIISNFTGGMDLTEAFSAFNTIAAQEGFENSTFEALFRYDEALGKWTYTQAGFTTALEVQKKALENSRDNAENILKEFNDAFNNIDSINLEDYSTELFTDDGLINQDVLNQIFSDLGISSDDEKTKSIIEKVLSNYSPKEGTIQQFIENTLKTYEQASKQAAAEYDAYLQNEGSLYKAGLDFGAIGSGIITEVQEQILEQRAKELNLSIKETEKIISSILDGDIESLEKLIGDLTYEEKTAILEGKTTTFSNAINQAIEEPGAMLDEAAGKILSDLGLATSQNGIYYVVSEARDFTKAIKSIIENGYLTLAERNELLASIYAEQISDTTLKVDFSSKTSLSYADLAKLATQRNIEFSEANRDALITSLGLEQDTFTGEFKITNFDDYWIGIHGSLDRKTAEYLEAYSNWAEEQISESTAFEEGLNTELENLIGAGIGDKIGVAYLESIVNNLNEFGMTVEQGVATVTDPSKIYELVREITEINYGKELTNSISTLKDSLNELFKNWADLIGSGIEGGLSYEGAEQLKSSFNLDDSDFSETQNGLKLSRDAAFQLYQELKKIDVVKARLVFDNITESLEEAGSGYEDIYATLKSIKDIEEKISEARESGNPERIASLETELKIAKEILAVRSTQPDDFNFMERELPTALQSPLSAWEGVGDAWKVLEGDDFKAGYIDYTDFYNMISMMEQTGVDLTDASLGFFKDSEQFNNNAEAAAALINEASNSLITIDGEVLIDLSQFGDNFVVGAEGMKSGLAEGIQTLAENQIDMIDAQIQLLETIVAMEEISDIDIDNDGIELGELFTVTEYDEDGIADSWTDIESLTEEHSKFLTNLLEKAKKDEKLLNNLNGTKINNLSLLEIFTAVSEGQYGVLHKAGLSIEQYLGLMQGIEKMVESGNYDLESVLSSVSEQLMQGFSGSGLLLDFGGKSLVFTPDGLSFEINWGEDGELINYINKSLGENFNEATIRDAIERVLAGKGKGQDQLIFHLATGQITIALDENGEPVYVTPDGERYTNPNKAFLKTATQGLEEVDTATTDLGEVGETKKAIGTYKMGSAIVTVTANENGEVWLGTGQDGSLIRAISKEDFIKQYAKTMEGDASYEQAAAELGIAVDFVINPEAVSKASPQEIQELANAYLSGDNTEFIKVAQKIQLIPQGVTVDPSDQAKINEYASAAGLSNIPVNVSLSITGLTGEESAKLAKNLPIIKTNLSTIAGLNFTNISTFVSSLSGVTESTQSGLQGIKDTLDALVSTGYTIELAYNITTTNEQEGSYNVSINDDGASQTLGTLATAITTLRSEATTATTTVNDFSVTPFTTNLDTMETSATEAGNAFATAAAQIAVAKKDIVNLKDAIKTLPDRSPQVQRTADAMSKLKSKTITATVKVNVNVDKGAAVSSRSITMTSSRAKGNVALAKGGPAKASGTKKTLMGELGPELVVSNGRYYVVGQNGAEFVDLADDAIVFNHLQTKKLLGAGGAVGTGEPVTNERNAVAFASGNVSGPAMASASDALAELYKLRALWQGLLDASAEELGQKAGSGLGGKAPGKGGGGSSGGGSGSGEEDKGYIHDLERWYNLLRQIEKLEQQITYEQAKRENMRDGYKYSESLQKELELLRKQKAAHEELAKLQKSYYEARRKDLESTDYAKIFTYDEDGLMQYVNGKNRGLDILATLNETDANGKIKRNAKQQLAYLKSIGFDTSVLKTNADGTKAETEEDQMQNFWDGIDGWMEEMDSLYDSYNDAAIATEEATQKMNEILQEYIDNQLEVEQKLLKAIEDREQAEIDRIQDEKDALEEAAQEYIDGLNDALSKEREMYDKNESEAETARLQRRLAILQRSGGSTSEIKALQDQIDSRLKDAYFQEQQDQIDAIQEASDNQIEKLQEQIDLMTETLEYQKENGLLWQEVYQMMNNWTPEAMLQFIEQYTQEYQQNSSLQNQ